MLDSWCFGSEQGVGAAEGRSSTRQPAIAGTGTTPSCSAYHLSWPEWWADLTLGSALVWPSVCSLSQG